MACMDACWGTADFILFNAAFANHNQMLHVREQNLGSAYSPLPVPATLTTMKAFFAVTLGSLPFNLL